MHEWSVSWNLRPCKLRAFMASNLNACPVLYSMHVLQALLNVDCKNHNCLDLVSTVRRDLRLTWMKWDGAPILGTRFLLLLSRAASSHFKVCFRQWRLCVCNRVGQCAVCYPVKQIFRSRANSVVLRRELRARGLDSSGAEFWSVSLLWRAYSSLK